MKPVHPEFVPDPSLSREEMEALQRDIADAATFADDFDFDPAAVCAGPDEFAVDENTTQRTLGSSADAAGRNTDATGSSPDATGTDSGGGDGSDRDDDAATDRGDAATDRPLVAGVDQAFLDDRAVSAIVVLRDGEVVERAHAVEPVEIPYIPGLLSFREGGAILSAFAELDRDPDLALVDGSGRIHFREAGLATHVGVTLDLPAVGVAKKLLCGTHSESLDAKLPHGTRIPVTADADVTAPDGTLIGYALQTRQFEGQDRYVNPLYVSPGHRVSAATAADLVERCGGEYKLPEPTRLADKYADELKAEVDE